MIAVKTHKDSICTDSEMPNFVVWSWMRTALKLSGSNLMLFAYIYSQSFDSSHCVTTSLTCLSEWFGLTRQTLARNIDRLPYVTKQTSDDHPCGFYGYYFYRVDMDAMLKDFSTGPDEVYQEFLASYKKLLILKFPDDKKRIEDYFKMFSDWHAGLSVAMRKEAKSFVTLGNRISNDEECSYKDIDFSTALQDVRDQITQLSNNLSVFLGNGEKETSTKVTLSNTPILESPPKKSLNTSKPKPKGARRPSDMGIIAKSQASKPASKEEKARIKQEKFNILIKELYELNTDFVTTHNIDDGRIIEALDNYVREIVEKEHNPKGLTAFRYKESLKQLAPILSPDDMLTHINDAIIGGYTKFVYDQEKIKKLNNLYTERLNIKEVAETFISKFPNASETFSTTIREYVNNCVLNTDGWTSFAFSCRMNELLNRQLTAEQVITVISDTLSCGWKQWNFRSVDNGSTSTVSQTPTVEMSAKESATDDFFRRHYFYQEPEIKTVLLDYLHNTSHGRSISCAKWDQEMEFLILHRHTNDDMIMAVKDAILHDYEHLCTVDYDKDRRIQHTYGTLVESVRMKDRTRQKHCEQERKKHPDDPRFDGMPRGFFDRLE